MKEQMRHIYKIMLIITTIMLQACGSSDDGPVFTISADVSDASFSNEFLQESTETIAIQVNFEGDGLVVGFRSGEESVFWLAHRTENVTENSATIFIDVINAQFLLPNDYSTTIRLAVSNDDSSKFASHDIDISLLIWSLAADRAKVKFNGSFGDETLPSQTLSIESETNEWTASADVDWLSLDVTSDVGDGVIEVTPDISSFIASGLQQGNIILTETTTGDSKLIPVDLALDDIYLFAERPAISLTSTADISAIEKIVTISNNGPLNVDWQASTDTDWLSVTVLNSNQLKLTADPSVAPMNESSLAQVVIAPSNDTSIVSDTISVNFYNSDLVVENKIISPLNVNNNEVLTSPLLPHFYVGVDNQLMTYHQYTGELETSLSISPEDTVLEQLIIHPAGEYLLAKAIETVFNEDDSSTSDVVHRYRINLIENSVTEILDSDIFFEPTDIVRLSGRYFVVTQALEFADENLKLLFWDGEDAFFATEVDVASQANTFFALDNTSVSFKRYTPQVNDFGDDRISTTLTHDYHPELLADGQVINDFFVSANESTIYAISPTSEWITFDGENFEDNGLLEASANVVTLFLEKDHSSQPNYLRVNITEPLNAYLDIYNDNQIISSDIITQGLLPSNMKLSGDDQRLILNVDSSSDPEIESKVELVTKAK
jgi:hypothetical protein